MAAPSPLPNYLYKILPSPPPQPLPAVLPLSPLDSKDGFIHLSTAVQVPKTAARFFSDAARLWLLRIRLDTLEDSKGDLKWEIAGDDGCFPHLYGAHIGIDEVEEVMEMQKGELGWEETLEGLEN